MRNVSTHNRAQRFVILIIFRGHDPRRPRIPAGALPKQDTRQSPGHKSALSLLSMRAAMPEAQSDDCITVAKIDSVSTKVVKSTSESNAAKCSAWLCDVSPVSVISLTSILWHICRRSEPKTKEEVSTTERQNIQQIIKVPIIEVACSPKKRCAPLSKKMPPKKSTPALLSYVVSALCRRCLGCRSRPLKSVMIERDSQPRHGPRLGKAA